MTVMFFCSHQHADSDAAADKDVTSSQHKNVTSASLYNLEVCHVTATFLLQLGKNVTVK